jgi:hypothetical protein
VKKILTALVVATGLLLTGCSNVDAALSLGDTKITTAELQTNVDSILAERAKVDTSQMQLESGEPLLRNQLNFRLLILAFSEIEKELDIQITSSEIAASRAEIIEQVGGEEALPAALVSASIAPEYLEGYLRALLTTQKLGEALSMTGVEEAEVQARIQELFVAKINELKIKVSPRYGTWDPATGTIIAAVPASDAVTPSKD